MIDPLLISLFVLVFEGGWAFRALEADAAKMEIADTKFTPPASGKKPDAI